MAYWNVNKGIGRNPEFRGLKAQYLFLFAGRLPGVFIVFVTMYMAGVNQWVCIVFGVAAASALVAATFRLNAKYGEHGLMKLQARMNHPRYIINRRRISSLFSTSPHTGVARHSGASRHSDRNETSAAAIKGTSATTKTKEA